MFAEVVTDAGVQVHDLAQRVGASLEPNVRREALALRVGRLGSTRSLGSRWLHTQAERQKTIGNAATVLHLTLLHSDSWIKIAR